MIKTYRSKSDSIRITASSLSRSAAALLATGALVLTGCAVTNPIDAAIAETVYGGPPPALDPTGKTFLLHVTSPMEVNRICMSAQRSVFSSNVPLPAQECVVPTETGEILIVVPHWRHGGRDYFGRAVSHALAHGVQLACDQPLGHWNVSETTSGCAEKGFNWRAAEAETLGEAYRYAFGIFPPAARYASTDAPANPSLMAAASSDTSGAGSDSRKPRAAGGAAPVEVELRDVAGGSEAVPAKAQGKWLARLAMGLHAQITFSPDEAQATADIERIARKTRVSASPVTGEHDAQGL